MNRLWEEKGEGVDMGAALGKVFPHQMACSSCSPGSVSQFSFTIFSLDFFFENKDFSSKIRIFRRK